MSCKSSPWYKSMTPAGRRYFLRLLSATITYLLLAIGSKWAFDHSHPIGLLVYILAVLPAAGLVGTLLVVARYVAEESDEFERTILLQSILWGLGASFALTTFWSSMQDFAQVPRLPTTIPYIVFWVVMSLSGSFIRLRYR